MKGFLYSFPLGFCIALLGCAQLSQPEYTPEQVAAIHRIKLISFESLPENMHIKIIGTAVGKYETTYGSADEMVRGIQTGAYQAGGDGYLTAVRTTDYIQMTNTTVITGKSPVVKFIEPTKDISLSDYAKGIKGGVISYSAARFAATYPESVDISREILNESLLCGCSNAKVVHKAQEILVSQLGHDAVDVLMPYIKSDQNGDSVNALKEISKVIVQTDSLELGRILKYHKLPKVQLEAAKILVNLGARDLVEDYAAKADPKLKAGLSEILL